MADPKNAMMTPVIKLKIPLEMVPNTVVATLTRLLWRFSPKKLINPAIRPLKFIKDKKIKAE